ncbi:MAG: MBL fold metallo-hydrolase [Legionella sp.]|nr:MAG: MBL fold metallo-hydrolase [Legionella sp.]
MTLKMIFLGSGSAFTNGPDNYQSNVLLEIDKDTLLIDAGTDIRHSLRAQQRNYSDIKNVYLTHLHCDHCGGLEWLALTTYFDPRYQGKPHLFTSEHLVKDLWDKTLSGGLSTLKDEEAKLATFFEVHSVKESEGFTWHAIDFKLVKTVHFCSNHQLMPSYGLFFSYNNSRIFYSSDTQNTPEQLMPYYEDADIIFHDCETQSSKSGVHANYKDLCQLPEQIKKKMWLYHYNPGALPDAKKDGFQGFVIKGQCFTF